MRDARAGGGTFLVNYLLDYGAGVLKMWFGGLIAKHCEDGAGGGGIFSGDSLTPALTYQLYKRSRTRTTTSLDDDIVHARERESSASSNSARAGPRSNKTR